MIRPKSCLNDAAIARDSSFGNGWGLLLLNMGNQRLANYLNIGFSRCLPECLDKAVDVIDGL